MAIDKAKLKIRQKKYRNAYSEERKAELRAYAKKWREEHRETCKKYSRDYYHSLPIERKTEKWSKLSKFMLEHPGYASEWAKKNRSKLASKRAARRALIESRIHPNANLEKIRIIFSETPSGMEVDHIIPLACGGWHHELNLQYLPKSLNRSKKDNMMYEPKGFRSWLDVPMFLLP